MLTHWWITGGASTDFAIISLYIDGETTPSLSFQPNLACGVGFNDDSQAPWSTKWFGKLAKSGAWSNKFRVPFQKSINITYRAGPGQPASDVIYMIVRGAENLPITIGGVTLPTTARMNLQITNATFSPLDYVTLVDVPTGNGLVFMQTLTFAAGNLNTLEGCYHAYTPYSTPYPGLLLSTGTEDYFDSAYYFNGGQFVTENSGFTHYASNSQGVTFSAYRFHDQDPLFFNDGIKFVWRNGDATDPATGLKCLIETGGNTVGSPTVANVVAYVWYYTW